MGRGSRTLIVVGLAVLVASLATFAMYRAVQQIPVREVEVASVFAVVAARPLPAGAQLGTVDMKVVPWPAKSPVPGGYASSEPLVGRGLVRPVLENEPITEATLAPMEGGSGMPTLIPTGMRAISVPVNEVVGVAGFVTPGTHVDLIVTLPQAENSVSRVVVSNIQVLAAGSKLEAGKQPDSAPVPSTVVTLLVTPDDAERVALAAVQGRLHLVLRNPLDPDATKTDGTRLAQLMGAPDPQPVQKVVRGIPRAIPVPAPVVEAPKLYTVETIRAAKRTEEVVK